MAEKIDLSLDDIIKSNKKSGATRGGGQGRGSGRGGKANGRSRSRSRGPTKVKQQQQQQGNKRKQSRARSRSRGRVAGGPRGASAGLVNAGPGKLILSNLDYGVTETDVQELFGEFGNLKSATLHYDRDGRSLGTADIVYVKRSDAVKGER